MHSRERKCVIFCLGFDTLTRAVTVTGCLFGTLLLEGALVGPEGVPNWQLSQGPVTARHDSETLFAYMNANCEAFVCYFNSLS